ncbi:Rv3235 family protein [Leifsonia poae]|uniref:Rv3235 family protein n=1 Tax=Leifsonia poae TaxID=110933 RepID=UPI001CBFA660|nr:Rv3235 family protein [Leifsonia poae]
MNTAFDYDFRTTPETPSGAKTKTRPVADFARPAIDTASLPDPAPLLVNLTRCVIEILAGVRELDQVARWVDDGVFLNLLRRVTIAARSRAVTGEQARRPRLTVGEPRVTEPCSGVVEAVVMAHQPMRSRAVAIRLEGMHGRWRASAITVL